MIGTKSSRTKNISSSNSNSNSNGTNPHKDTTPTPTHTNSDRILRKNADDSKKSNRSSSGRCLAVFLLLLITSRVVDRTNVVVVVVEAFQFHVRSSHRIGLYRLGNCNYNCNCNCNYNAYANTALVSSATKAGTAVVTMRDRSASYWFSVGDRVRVVEDVVCSASSGFGSNNSISNKFNLKGAVGTVVETWEKCDVDPTCCCAEQVDTDMAVRVVFCNDNKEEDDGDDDEDEDVDKSENEKLPATTTTTTTSSSSPFYYYFAEEELMKV